MSLMKIYLFGIPPISLFLELIVWLVIKDRIRLNNSGLIIYRKVFYLVILKKKIRFIECGKLFYLTMKLIVIVEILLQFVTNLLIFNFSFILGAQAKRARPMKSLTHLTENTHTS